MDIMVKLSAFLLFALALWAVYAVGFFSYRNGTIALMQQAVASRRLPSSGEPLMTEFTGFPVIDEIAMNVIPFFYSVVDGSSPGLLLHGLNFMGEVTAVWALVCVESLRTANKGRLISLLVAFILLLVIFQFQYNKIVHCGERFYEEVVLGVYLIIG